MQQCDYISVTFKFGFFQNRLQFPDPKSSTNFLANVYYQAEQWIREVSVSLGDSQMFGHYWLHLLRHRINSAEFQFVPIQKIRDIEQNSIIELVLSPINRFGQSHALKNESLSSSGSPPTCNRCSHPISGTWYQCIDCSVCFHKSCSLLVQEECPKNNATLSTAATLNVLQIDHQFKAAIQSGPPHASHPVPLPPPIFPPQKLSTVIAKGIFPACDRGDQIYRRYAFFLTRDHLWISHNLASINEMSLPTLTDNDIKLPLSKIRDLVLTHRKRSYDDIFQILCTSGAVISVGKKADEDRTQMETAQFYSWMLDQWQSLVNAMPAPELPSETESNVVYRGTPRPNEPPVQLAMRKSSFKIIPETENDQSQDLFQLYQLTNEKIGEGQFGRVVGAIRISTKEPVAIKVIQKNTNNLAEINLIHAEINNLYQFNHMNILQLEAYFDFDESVYLITERLDTDMCQYILTAPGQHLNESIARLLIYQLIIALRYLDSHSYCHLDVKCENVLLRFLNPISTQGKPAKAVPLLKLADFGYSRIIGEHSFRKTRVGTKVYSAPEIHKSSLGYNRSVDMWSLGIVLYASLSGQLPYSDDQVVYAEKFLTNRENFFGNPVWSTVSNEAKDLILNKLLVVEPSARVRPNHALFEEWFTDFTLFQDLREVERRARHFMQQKNRPLLHPYWLTSEREDLVWIQYRKRYTKMINEQSTT